MKKVLICFLIFCSSTIFISSVKAITISFNDLVNDLDTGSLTTEARDNGATVAFAATSSSITVTMVKDDETLITNFSYANRIISYTAPLNATAKQVFNDTVWVTQIIYSAANLVGIDPEDFFYNMDLEDLTIATNGMEYVEASMQGEETRNYAAVFKIDLGNAFGMGTPYIPDEEEIPVGDEDEEEIPINIEVIPENPETGGHVPLIIISLATGLAIWLQGISKSKNKLYKI